MSHKKNNISKKVQTPAPRPAEAFLVPRSTKYPLWLVMALRSSLPALLTVGLCAAIMLWVALPVYRNSLIEAKKKEISELTTLVWQLLNDYEKRVENGELTLQQAQTRAKERIRAMRYGPDRTEYFWINNNQQPDKIIMHPAQQYLEKPGVTDIQDQKGVLIVDKIQKAVKKTGKGFVTYHWQGKYDTSKIVPKISHVRLYKPWGWIIGTGAYIDDLQEEISSIVKNMVYIFIGILALILLTSFGMSYQAALTERRRRYTAEKLMQSEAKFRNLVESSSDFIWEVDKKGKYTYASPQIETILGYKPEEIIGKSAFDFMAEKEKHLASAEFEHRVKSGTPIVAFPCVNIHKNGHEVILESSAVPVISDAGKLIGFRGVDRDITERKKAQNELRDAHSQLKNILDSTLQVSITATDKNGVLTVFNTGAEHMLGYSADEMIGKQTPEIYHLESEVKFYQKQLTKEYGVKAENFNSLAIKAIEGGYEEHECTYVRKDGKHVQVQLGVTAIRDENGNITGFLGVATDITKRKNAENALEKRLIALTQPIDSAEDIDFDNLFNLEDVQQLQDQFAKTFGVASIITHTDGSPITKPSNFTHLCENIIRKTEKGLANCQKSDAKLGRLKVDGPAIQPCLSCGLWDAGTAITVGGKHIANWLIGQVRDETQTEDSIRQYAHEIGADEEAMVKAFLDVPAMSFQKFQDLANTLFTIARQLSITAYQNIQQARFITERKQIEEKLRRNEENLSTTLNSIGDAVIATDIHGRITRMNPVAQHLTGWDINDAQGKALTEVFRIINSDTRKAVDSPAKKVLATGEIVGLANHTLLISKDRTEYQIADSGAPIRDQNGQTIGVVLVFRDVTEEYSLQERLQQSQKMEAIGQLAGGVAHDFNNLLGGILGYAQLLEMKFAKESEEFKFANQIENAANQAAGLTKQLLDFSRKGKLQTSKVDLHKVINEVVSLLARSIDKRIEIRKTFDSISSVVEGDPAQLQNTILNLGVNARDAMPDGGTMTFATENIILDEEYCRQHLEEISPGSYIVISVSDTGIGMSSQLQQHIFEPFFTTKPKGEGTGLGLASVYGCIKSHHGLIRCYSEPGIGTDFKIFLPVADVEEKPRKKLQNLPPVRGQGHILVVDDEKIVSDFAAQMLGDLGYTVSVCSNGGEAVEFFRSHYNEIDLVILDLIMPILSGNEVFRKMKDIKPDVRVLIASGFTQSSITTDMLENGALAFLNKPFRVNELAELVARYIK